MQKRPGERHELPLPHRDAFARLAYVGVETLRQGVQPVPAADTRRHRRYRLVGGVRHTVADVVAHRTAK